MIKNIIREVIEESGQVIGDINILVNQVYDELKSSAKTIFFEGKANDLKDFIFDIPNEKNEVIKKRLSESIHNIAGDGEEFIQKLKERIMKKLDEIKAERNLESLLDLFDFGHLKDMLKMFKL